jgi:UDP-2,3-diacylglucosamine hydrolase
VAAPATLAAPDDWRAVEFISDLHLSPATPRTTAAWQRYLRETDADAVFLLGDIFEVWVGDDSAQLAGFEADAAVTLADSARRRFTAFMAGNRDFLLGDALLARCGVRRLADPTRLDAWGHAVLLSHGDELCVGDTAYQRFRSEVRGAAWQQRFLSQPLADRRALARTMRDASEQLKRAARPEDWADVDDTAAAQWLREAGCTRLIHGHTHRPGRVPLADGLERVVLSDWDLDHGAPRAEVLRLTPDGALHRLPVAQSAT